MIHPWYGLRVCTHRAQFVGQDPEALPDGLLSDAEVQQVVDKVAEEVDPEGLGLLFTDFEAVASRMPDFCVNLRIDL